MRITGGELSGRIVRVPKGVIRPAMDRMRESVFAILGPLDGLTFLDLFAGSGIMSLEAVSRGADGATAVERDAGKRVVLAENLGIAGNRVRLVISPAERYIARSQESFDIVYLDPPFDYRYKADLLRRIDRTNLVTAGGRLLIHYPHPEELPSDMTSFRTTDERTYGRSRVRFYTRD